MKVIYNKEVLTLPFTPMTVAQFIKWKEISTISMAFTINNRMVKKTEWESRYIDENDNIVVINAAFGG